MTPQMKLSIIIVNYRAWGHLQNALDALADDFPSDWEIIIVDNESEPASFSAFEQKNAWVRLVANPVNSGFGFSCIIGVKEASGEQLLFMNPDVIATATQIRELINEKAKDSQIALLSPKQVGVDGKPQKVFDEFPDWVNQSKILKSLRRVIFPGRKPDPRADYEELVFCDWVTGSCLLVDRAGYDAIGGWSPDFWMYVEDADLCRRAHDLGMRVAYTPNVQVIHAHGGSSRINVAVKSMTKLEVIISKHVYNARHAKPLARFIIHFLIPLLRLPGLVVAFLLDLLTARQVATLNVRTGVLSGLLSYYWGALKNHSWLSPRAQINQS
jgi:GT2 family glycosyltransferase